MQKVAIEEFARRTLGGRPVKANLSVYDSQSFECGCGESHHVHDDGVEALRELRNMRFVVGKPSLTLNRKTLKNFVAR